MTKKAETTAAEREVLRAKMMTEIVLPQVQRHFETHSRLKTAVACVAQYWDDEASDAVHCKLAFSVNATPNLEKCEYGGLGNDFWNETTRKSEMWSGQDYHNGCSFDYNAKGNYWPDNGEAIPLFAAFCNDGSSQDCDFHEAYTPYAVFTKQDDGTIKTVVVGKMLRPWLDGVRPEWEDENEDEDKEDE